MSAIGVIDVETTGLYPQRHDRIVEVAAVVVRPDGEILREFVSLINPERDIGPTSIHGLAAGDVMPAPRFADMAGRLLEALDGCVALAGHNVRFDLAFLAAEFLRLGHTFPDGPLFCTLEMAGGRSLSSCCADYGIAQGDKAHAALQDARTSAHLLAVLLSHVPQKANEISQMLPIAWPRVLRSSVLPVTRDAVLARKKDPPTYLQKLLARVRNVLPLDTDDSGEIAYIALIDRTLEDRCVDEFEGDALCEMAARWGITAERIREMHQRYLDHLIAGALADGIVADAERRDLSLVAHLLGVDQRHLDEMLDGASEKLSEVSLSPRSLEPADDSCHLAGMRVCFTGEFQCRYRRTPITRETAIELAVSHGMNVVDSVTKKVDLLVVADPDTQSGKAKKARQYGIRIMHEPVFWRKLGVEVE